MKTLRHWQIKVVVTLAVMFIRSPQAHGYFLFGPPENLGPAVNSPDSEYDPSISADGLELYFQSNRSSGYGDRDIYVARRATKEDKWSQAINLGSIINSSTRDAGPEISSDGLSLYFNSSRAGGSGNYDLYVTTRQSISEPWGSPVNLGTTVNTTADEISSSISSDGLSLFFSDGDALGTIARSGGYGGADIWVAQRTSPSDAWGPPTNLGPEINESFTAGAPEISSDGLTLFFSGYRPSTGGTNDLWFARRNAIDAPWGAPVNLGPMVNSESDADLNPSISPDGRMLYFASFRPGGSGFSDIWQVPIEPVVDLNGDEIVNSADMTILVEHWQTDDPLCDIGPMPWGDGIVDVQDLMVLAEHLFEEIFPIELIAYWRLDEAEGDIARDSVGENDAFVIGDPIWQPGHGQVDGALELDGVDDSIIADSTLNPAEGPFSIFVWVRNGAAGQAVMSEANGTNWLCTDPLEGCLMTELPSSGRVKGPLLSQTVVTDGNWHQIGLVWDGSYRRLYADGIEVARDTARLSGLKDAYGNLHIGVGSTLAPDTFFSGLIDDIRIYNVALSAEEIAALAH